MEDLTSFKGRIKNATRRFSRKGSYDCDLQIPSFKVRTVCAEGIHVETLERESSNNAVDEALGLLGSLEERNKQEVVLKISIRDGIQIVSKKNKKKVVLSYKMHQVGYCNVDKRYPNIFVFIAAKVQTELRCHIFSCDGAQKARAVCLTMAKAFENSFQNWQKSKEMSTPDLNHNRVIDRRRSADVIQVPTMKQLEKRRASDFLPIPTSTRLNIRRSSADAIAESSDEDSSNDEEMSQAYQDILSKSAERGTCSLLRRGSTDWDAIAKDEEVKRKMEGDLILWD